MSSKLDSQQQTPSITPASFSGDSILHALMFITRFYNKSVSINSITHGLPMDDQSMTPALMMRAAKRAGLKSGVVARNLSDISADVLPAVLFLKNKTACVLLSKGFEGGKRATDSVQVYFPLSNEMREFSSMEVFDAENAYSGYIGLFKDEGGRSGGAIVGVSEANGDALTSGQSWFWGTLKQFKSIYIQVGLAAIFINLMALISPLFVMNVYDRVVPNGAFETLWVLALGVFLAYTFDFILRMLRGYFVDVAGKGADILLAGRLFQQVMNIRLGMQGASAGAFANQLREYESLRDFFTSATLVTLVDLPFVLLFVMIIALIGGPIALIPLLAIPLVLAVSFIVQKPVQKIMHEASEEMDAKHGHLVETLNGMETIKSLNAQSRVQKHWEQSVGVVAQVGMRSRFLTSIALNFATYVQQVVTVGVVVYGVYLIADGKLSVGALVACTLLVGRTLAPLSQAVSLYSRFQQSRTALANLNAIMAMETERPAGKNFLSHQTVGGDISLKGVGFIYPNSPLKSLFDVDIDIKKGEKVAIIGRTGSGKSTLLRLMQGLYLPTSGSILLDGLELRQLDPAEFRNQIGYVPQNLMLFSGSLRENLLMGNSYASEVDVSSVMQRYGVVDFAQRHPMGVDMPVGESGSSLSGGQRQVVSIARAMIKNPSLVLLDEPTSELDQGTERKVIQALKEDMEGKTVVVVTHKMSILELADRVIVMDFGKVIMDGTKKEVIAQLKKGTVQA